MKRIALIFSVLLLGFLAMSRAELLSRSSKAPLWAQMQMAVLQKQDLGKIKKILKAGFKIDDPIGCGTFNCVDGAVAVHNMKMLTFLLAEGAQPKGSALYQAVWCKDADLSAQMVEVLLKAGSNPNYKEYMGQQNHYFSPLHVACFKGYFPVVQLLLNHPGTELNALDVDDNTPLMEATVNGNEQIVRLLLAKGADPTVTNARGETAVDLTRRKNGNGYKILRILTGSQGRRI